MTTFIDLIPFYSLILINFKQIRINKRNNFHNRHSNGSNDDGDDPVDDARSLSRSASENNVNQQNGAQNGLLNINNNNNENNNNGYIFPISKNALFCSLDSFLFSPCTKFLVNILALIFSSFFKYLILKFAKHSNWIKKLFNEI